MTKKGCGCEVDDAGTVLKACPNQEKAVVVARKPCGCCIAVYVVPDADASPEQFQSFALELRDWERKGRIREQRTVGWVRHTAAEDGGLQFRCPHGPPKRRIRAGGGDAA